MSTEDDLTVDIDALRERSFLVALDPNHGHVAAAKAGFVPASYQVATEESMHVMRSTLRLEALGLVSRLREYADWYTSAVESSMVDSLGEAVKLPEIYKEAQIQSLKAFTTAALINLLDDGLIEVPNMSSIVLEESMVDSTTLEPVHRERYQEDINALEKLLAGPLVDEPVIVPHPEGAHHEEE